MSDLYFRTDLNIPEGLQIIQDFGDFTVVEKPSGLLSVPGRTSDNQDCITRRFRDHFAECIEQPAVHRLDWETSGLLVLAKTRDAHRALSIQFQDRIVQKRYIAVVDGIVLEQEGRIELPFRLDVDNRPYQIYDEVYGKIGISLWKNLGIENQQTRIEYTPLTGRTHQLRLHSAHAKGLGFPIVGDGLYGTGKKANELKLHAAFLSFLIPNTQERIEINSPPPF
jgi:tRNA pseudouridine32 synthase/23S rRNA pseudouridine746 synthase